MLDFKNSYVGKLYAEYIKRKKNNNKYSLRAFSRDLDLDVSHLTRILNNQKNISLIKAKRIAKTLFKDEFEQQEFIELVKASRNKKNQLGKSYLQTVRTLTSEESLILNNWVNIAVLDLLDVQVRTFSTAKEIAQTLQVPLNQAQKSLQTLLKLELIEKKSFFKKKVKRLKYSSQIPHPLIRQYHKQMIGNAIKAIDTQSTQQRYLLAKTLTVSKKQYEQIIKKIDLFYEDIVKITQQHPEHDRLYQMNLQFFDLAPGLRETNHEDSN